MGAEGESGRTGVQGLPGILQFSAHTPLLSLQNPNVLRSKCQPSVGAPKGRGVQWGRGPWLSWDRGQTWSTNPCCTRLTSSHHEDLTLIPDWAPPPRGLRRPGLCPGEQGWREGDGLEPEVLGWVSAPLVTSQRDDPGTSLSLHLLSCKMAPSLPRTGHSGQSLL